MNLNRQNRIVIVVIALLLTLTVGYAVFNQSLSITGTATTEGKLKVIFSEIGTIEEAGSTGATATIGADKTSVDVNVPKLEYPGSYAKIPVKIKNDGSIDAMVTGVQTQGLDDNDIEVTYSNVKINDVLKIGAEQEIVIKVMWKESSENKSVSLDFSITLNYRQITADDVIASTTSASGGGSTVSFPVVTGSYGESVTYTYDNGNIVLSGTGDMSTEKLYNVIEGDVIPLLGVSEKIGNYLKGGLNAFIAGSTYEEAAGSREELRQMLVKPQSEEGLGLTDEEAEEFLGVLDSVPTPKSITVEENITSMGNLQEFKYITELTVPSTVTTISSNSLSMPNLTTIINKTGKTFDWNAALGTTSSDAFETGTVTIGDRTININGQ